jgi:hypothetical protein
VTSTGLDEAKILVDSYGESSALGRLAQLAAPACQVEPQLLRQLRLGCVPDADVSVEQELWHSELVNARGKSITFRSQVSRVLRDRLREWRAREPAVVATARTLTRSLHAGLSPLLVLEDELAWAEIFDENDTIHSGAQKLLSSLLARREGVNHWLGRAWAGLPTELKKLPEGRQLAQVAAAEGASVAEDSTRPAGDKVAHMLPVVSLPLKVHGLALDVNVPPLEATHVLDVPRTQPRALSVSWPGGREDLVFAETELRTLHVRPGVIVLRTLAGSEYEIEVAAVGHQRGAASQTTLFEVEMLPAGAGAALIVRYGSGSAVQQIVVDCGDRRTGKLLGERLRKTSAEEPIVLLVITHSDDDRIGGARALLEDPKVRVREIWVNLPEASTTAV